MKKGFTLIEILIVMAIISLLATVFLPNIFKVQNKAKEAAVKAVMYNLQAELESYQLDNFEYPLGNNLSIAELSLILKYKLPNNPFTGEQYKSGDSSGQIIYNYSQDTGIYQLSSYKRDGTSQLALLTNN